MFSSGWECDNKGMIEGYIFHEPGYGQPVTHIGPAAEPKNGKFGLEYSCGNCGHRYTDPLLTV